MKYQHLTPKTNYYLDLKDCDVYVISDHVSPLHDFEKSKNDLGDAFNRINVDSTTKIFIFDHYLFLNNYQTNSFFTGESYPLRCCVEYIKQMPDYYPTFDNKNISFTCQMNKQRFIRVIASSWLLNYKFGKVNFLYSQPWDINFDYSTFLKSLYIKNKLPLKNEVLPAIWWDMPILDNAYIFKNCLKNELFAPAAVSLVFEPIEFELGNMITEKYIDAIYGGTIPIVYGYKIYETLEKLGFDTFSDIINTSYQYIEDPCERILSMLDDNTHLLDRYALDLIKNKNIQERIMQNYTKVRNIDNMFSSILNLNTKTMMDQYFKHKSIISKFCPIFDNLHQKKLLLDIYFGP